MLRKNCAENQLACLQTRRKSACMCTATVVPATIKIEHCKFKQFSFQQCTDIVAHHSNLSKTTLHIYCGMLTSRAGCTARDAPGLRSCVPTHVYSLRLNFTISFQIPSQTMTTHVQHPSTPLASILFIS